MLSIHRLPELSGRVLWLIPSGSIISTYQREISRLADRFKTTAFYPHLTLGSLPIDSLESTISKVRGVFNNNRSDFTLSHKSVNCSSSPYQNLVHSLLPDLKMQRLQSDLKVVMPNYSSKKEYHISLMYGRVSCDKLTEESEFLALKLPQTIHFTKIRMIELTERPEFWKTVWETNI